MSEDERIQIAELRRDGVSVATIAEQVNRARSTICRELKRNVGSSCAVRPHGVLLPPPNVRARPP
ncbi:helix-turn-helix domain-containing protein [Rhodococcus coprophilus]|uniref:helix-turn-helix domain-containing protein n=1 Tax=Rhodococcus coprophilus TaxID=38310 RepID=UPI001EF87D41|nr:helix-turn-helix domain-containing protein [Rhodococcus coprophilus]